LRCTSPTWNESAVIISATSRALDSTIKFGVAIAPQNSVSTTRHSKLAG
jgi:hypothetical protein